MTKQSPVAHKHDENVYEFGELNGYRVPLSIHDKTKGEFQNNGLTLCDMSSLNRLGYRGALIDQWIMKNHQIELPDINQACLIERGLLLARLSQTEIMMLEDIGARESDFAKVIDNSKTNVLSSEFPETYLLPRQDSHACFLMMGDHCAELFSKLCAVDMSIDKFANMSMLQTSMARTSVIVIRNDRNDSPSYMILIDTSLAEYLWDCLLDAMDEFGGIVTTANMLGIE
jgi:sarcosine oxidase, subunit gamma